MQRAASLFTISLSDKGRVKSADFSPAKINGSGGSHYVAAGNQPLKSNPRHAHKKNEKDGTGRSAQTPTSTSVQKMPYKIYHNFPQTEFFTNITKQCKLIIQHYL